MKRRWKSCSPRAAWAQPVGMSDRIPSRSVDLHDVAATEALAARIAGLSRPGDIILLEGSLGAGKTTFARAFLRAASGNPGLDVPSPTFTLVQSYQTGLGWVHHYD